MTDDGVNEVAGVVAERPRAPVLLFARWRLSGGQGLGDGSPVHLVAGGEGANRKVFVLVVGADGGEQPGSGLAPLLDEYGLRHPFGVSGPRSRDGRTDKRALQVRGGSAGRLGQAFYLDAGALRAGEPGAEVAGAQVVGSGQPSDVGLDGFPGDRAGSNG
jgi:hypothetical protein